MGWLDHGRSRIIVQRIAKRTEHQSHAVEPVIGIAAMQPEFGTNEFLSLSREAFG